MNFSQTDYAKAIAVNHIRCATEKAEWMLATLPKSDVEAVKAEVLREIEAGKGRIEQMGLMREAGEG